MSTAPKFAKTLNPIQFPSLLFLYDYYTLIFQGASMSVVSTFSEGENCPKMNLAGKKHLKRGQYRKGTFSNFYSNYFVFFPEIF